MGILVFGRRQDDDDDGKTDQWVEVISSEPRAYVYHNFLVSLLKISSLTNSVTLCLCLLLVILHLYFFVNFMRTAMPQFVEN